MNANQLAQLVMRIGSGINMLMHNLVRIPKLIGFVGKTAAGFANTILPDVLTRAFCTDYHSLNWPVAYSFCWAGQ